MEYLPEWRVVVCRQCGHAVWPREIQAHLRGRKHRKRSDEAKAIASEARRHEGLLESQQEFRVPPYTEEAIPYLNVFRDRLLCQADSGICRYICGVAANMRKHVRKEHAPRGSTRKGRPTTVMQLLEKEGPRQWKIVTAQRFFVQGYGSQYFEVRQPGEAVEGAGTACAWERATQQASRKMEELESEERRRIDEGEADEANPWLERTGWAKYLAGLDRVELMAAADEPDPEKEPVEREMWDVVGRLAAFSQESVEERVGVFVRMEAIRTEKHQTRYQPLQPYRDRGAVKRHCRPWQQALVFFARTRKQHDWRSPRYKFTSRQRDAWIALLARAERATNKAAEEGSSASQESGGEYRLGEAGEEGKGKIKKKVRLSHLEKACLNFLIALLDQRAAEREYECALVCALAVLGIRSGGWMGANEYPPILSRLIKVARFFVVQQAIESVGGEGDGIGGVGEASRPLSSSSSGSSGSSSSSDSRSVLSDNPRGSIPLTANLMDRFMVRGSHGPMQWMLDLRTYGLKIHYNTTSDGHIDWIGERRETVVYKQIEFGMADLRGFVHGLVDDTRQLLVKRLLFEESRQTAPRIPWAKLRDNPKDRRPGWSFTKDERNQFAVEGATWLWQRIGGDERTRRRFLAASRAGGSTDSSGNELPWNQAGVREYLDSLAEFQAKLLVLTHISGGQPARAPEILSIRHRNTASGEHRNAFVENGKVVFVTRYHKGYSVSGDVKIIHRYLPREVGELYVWWQWLVLPFQQRLQALVYGEDRISSHVWPRESAAAKWDAVRMRKALEKESAIGLGQKFGIQAWRELAIGISRRFLRGREPFRQDEDDEDGDWNEDEGGGEAAITDEQAGHSSHVAGMVYARGIDEMTGAVASKRQRFRLSSEAWHAFLGFESAQSRGSGAKRKDCGDGFDGPKEGETEHASFSRWSRLRAADLKARLRALYGSEAAFRGVQEPALQAIVKGESPVAAVMPTGGGKSLIFMLPAACGQGGTTVVVVPLISLRADLQRRCDEAGIECREWNGRRQPDAASIVLVTPESALSDAFATFLNRLKAAQQLDRIVIDECHVVLNDKFDFRKQMQQLGSLAAAETQMVMLTATLPPHKEDELWRRMGWHRGQVKMFRAATTRKNVAYAVREVDEKRHDEGVAALVEELRGKHSCGGKIIVYCGTVERVRTTAKLLNCDPYYSGVEGRQEKLKRFTTRGGPDTIVATSALGLGVDIPDIRAIVHADVPRGLLDYSQESGRAGRDLERSTAAVVVGRGWRERLERGKLCPREDKDLVLRFLGGRECRRAVLDEYLDGRERLNGCVEAEEEEKCDVCGGVKWQRQSGRHEREKATKKNQDDEEERRRLAEEQERRVYTEQRQQRRVIRRRRTERASNEEATVEELERRLRAWMRKCGFCTGRGIEHGEHRLRDCTEADAAQAQRSAETISQKIRFARYSGCFECGVPQSLCGKWKPKKDGFGFARGGGECQYAGVLTETIAGLLYGFGDEITREVEGRIAAEGFDAENEEETLAYFGRKVVWARVESNGLCKEFLDISEGV